MKRTVIIISAVVIFILALIIALVFINLPTRPPSVPNLSERKAIILGSANDFYDSEVEEYFNGGNDSNFNNDNSLGNWTFLQYDGGTDAYHHNTYGHPSNPILGSIYMDWSAPGPSFQNATFVLDWNANYDLVEYAYYNVSAWIEIQGSDFSNGGARVGIRWKDLIGNIVRTDWTTNISLADGQWHLVNVASVCNNDTNNEIAQMELVLAAQGDFLDAHQVYFDEIKVDRWISVNLTDPTDPDPPPTKIDSDGFPAQALHVYWVLRNNGYSDENIFFMLYHKNDPDIDIKTGDGITNDLDGAVIDVEDDDVNASRFKLELNASISGSFASEVDDNDKLIIFMTDHGSNRILGDGNATFHFEADHSFINEFEFYDLVKNLKYERLMINVDCCFSGNFLCKDKNIGVNWYDIPNCILVSAASNVFSWYWINNLNADGFAGSWFFHPFWEQLNQNQTIINAFNFALNFIPAGRFQPVAIIQMPLIYDNMGINTTLSFNSDPPL